MDGEEGLLLDVAGGGEVVIALAAGADPARMLLGRHCESGDQLIDDVPLDNPAVGDLLARGVPLARRGQ